MYKDIIHKGYISTLHNYSFKNIVISVFSTIITVLAAYLILNKITPNFIKKVTSQKLSVINLLKAFGIGLACIILVSLASALLLLTFVGAKLGIILALLFIALCLISVPILTIVITKSLETILRLEKTILYLLALVLVSLVLYGLTLIPFAGLILNFIIKVTAIGLIVSIYLPHRKKLSAEEKAAKAEAKEVVRKLAKEEKEKRKQEKMAKKQAKLEAKESNK